MIGERGGGETRLTALELTVLGLTVLGLTALGLTALGLTALLLTESWLTGSWFVGSWMEPGSVAHAQHVSTDDHRFQVAVQEAIDKGVGWLYDDLRERGIGQGIASEYPMGLRALLLYALLEAGVAADLPVLRQLVTELERLPLRRVYGVSLLVLALDAAERHPVTPAEPAHGRTKVRDAPGLSATGHKQLRAAVEWLIQARQRGEGMWGYEPVQTRGRGPATWVDFSNLQFAVLALHAAQRHDIAVPAELWTEVLRALSEAALPRGGPATLACEGLGWWPRASGAEGSRSAPDPEVVSLVAHGFELRGAPLGWPYRPNWNLPPWVQQSPSTSMTAAAVSSLMAARAGLAQANALSSDQRARLDELVAGGVIELARQLGSLVPAPGDSLWRNYYYTLYSFEKAMDLGAITRLGARDWYRDQARVLIAAQRTEGAWGGSLGRAPRGGGRSGDTHDQERVDTAFALLFLKRATRALRVDPAGLIETLGDPGSVPTGVAAGVVFVASRGGLVQLNELFPRLGVERSRDLLAAAEEVVRCVGPHEQHELLPHVMRLRDGSHDPVEQFARRLIRDLAGLPGEVPETQLLAWLDRVRELETWAASRAAAQWPAVVAHLAGDNAPLRLRACVTLERLASLDAVPALIAHLQRAGPDAVRVEAALRAITRQDPGGAPGPERADLWQRFWDQHAGRLRADRLWDRFRQELELARSAPERARVRASIVALGPAVLPRVQEILAGDSFAFDWVLIAQSLTGEVPGL